MYLNVMLGRENINDIIFWYVHCIDEVLYCILFFNYETTLSNTVLDGSTVGLVWKLTGIVVHLLRIGLI